MTFTPTPPTVPAWRTITTWGIVATALGAAWSAFGWRPDWLGQFQAVTPHILTILGLFGVLVDHATASPRKVTLRFHSAARTFALFLTLCLSLVFLTGCPQPVNPPSTQPSSQLQLEQTQLNNISTLVNGGYDLFLLYNISNPNPAEALLAKKAYDAVEAAIAKVQSHIDAGDAPSASGALADVNAALQNFLQATANARTATHKARLRLRG